MSKNWFDQYYAGLTAIEGNAAFDQWCQQLSEQMQQAYENSRHGNLPHWQSVLRALPEWDTVQCCLQEQAVAVSSEQGKVDEKLIEQLRVFKPWRKGPYRLGSIDIDSEWRSDLKWERLKSHISDLTDRLVLDVGSGNGYHCWRMAGAGAKAVLGIDPMLLYVMQYYVIQHFIRSENVFVLPFGLEALPTNMQAFDTVFSMGVLYHRRSPLQHLIDLKACLKPGGELVLETLVIEGGVKHVLVPEERYARMKNVWFIPSVELLQLWMRRCGFIDIRVIDVTATTQTEQRSTPWSGDASLVDFLDSQQPNKTVEGYPAPLRATLLAKR